ncbi:MAG: dUTP diphosphatase [candidate division WOR-3 bacterium]|nr:dUTP diphosphatase [candidate division WOR-3 bacterium]
MDEIRVKIRIENGREPVYMTEGSAGADIFSSEERVIQSGETALIKTGIFISVPAGYECQIRPRSGLALKKQITILNSPGTIDSDYRGEIGIIMHNLSDSPFTVKKDDRIAQMVFAPVVKARFIESDLEETERSSGGFGHTGINGKSDD